MCLLTARQYYDNDLLRRRLHTLPSWLWFKNTNHVYVRKLRYIVCIVRKPNNIEVVSRIYLWTYSAYPYSKKPPLPHIHIPSGYAFVSLAYMYNFQIVLEYSGVRGTSNNVVRATVSIFHLVTHHIVYVFGEIWQAKAQLSY